MTWANSNDLHDTDRAHRVGVILGDQLDRSYPAHLGLDKRSDVLLMMEVEEESTRTPSHVQRTVLFLSAMRHHALALRRNGWRVRYVTLDDPANTQSFTTEVERCAQDASCERVACVLPGDKHVRAMIEEACENAEVGLDITDDPHFFTTPADFNAWADGRKSLTMEYFYREQRRRLGYLMDGKDPVGGAWNFDKDNRETFKRAPDVPEPYWPRVDAITNQVIETVRERLPELPGLLDDDHPFRWPVTREAAKKALDEFIEHRLADFGPFEDAMWTGERTLYHSVLSPLINLKLLSPRECVEAAIDAYGRGEAPINSVEGFVRQLIGWREFMRGVYYRYDDYTRRNALGHTGDLPDFYWTGDTDMRCMADCVSSVRELAWAHHIPRLMVMANFALLAGVEPAQVEDWFLGMYADGVEWATAPNVIGMGLYADHAVVGTKPYAASGKYIKKMSNYCKGCRYNVNERTGDDACPFNTLYWDFLIRHEDRFTGNNRMAMILKHVEKMSREEKISIRVSASAVKKKVGVSSE
ncbi:MAG: cryptochrome/photolyase family protein [Phycisphaerales bacterium]